MIHCADCGKVPCTSSCKGAEFTQDDAARLREMFPPAKEGEALIVVDIDPPLEMRVDPAAWTTHKVKPVTGIAGLDWGELERRLGPVLE